MEKLRKKVKGTRSEGRSLEVGENLGNRNSACKGGLRCLDGLRFALCGAICATIYGIMYFYGES